MEWFVHSPPKQYQKCTMSVDVGTIALRTGGRTPSSPQNIIMAIKPIDVFDYSEERVVTQFGKELAAVLQHKQQLLRLLTETLHSRPYPLSANVLSVEFQDGYAGQMIGCIFLSPDDEQYSLEFFAAGTAFATLVKQYIGTESEILQPHYKHIFDYFIRILLAKLILSELPNS